MLVKHKFERMQFTRRRQQAFLEDLYSLIEDGVPVSQAIDTIAQVSEGISQRAAKAMLVTIGQGQTLADSMSPWFSSSVTEIIRAGEAGGTLEAAMEAAVRTFSQQLNAISALLTALVYPVMVIVLACVVIVFVKHTVLNNFAEIKPVSQWPVTGQQLYHLAQFIQAGWWYLLLVIGCILFLIYRMLCYFTGSFRSVVDQMPMLSIYRQVIASRFMETLGLLIQNGVVIRQALGVMHVGASPYLSWHLLMMEHRLSGGQDNIADVLDTNLLNREDLVRLRVVSKGKGFSHALISLGQKAQVRNAKRIAITGKLVGGLFLVLGAFLAAAIVFGIYTIGSSIAT